MAPVYILRINSYCAIGKSHDWSALLYVVNENNEIRHSWKGAIRECFGEWEYMPSIKRNQKETAIHIAESFREHCICATSLLELFEELKPMWGLYGSLKALSLIV